MSDTADPPTSPENGPPADWSRRRIRTSDPLAVLHWSRLLAVTEDQLLGAIRKVGDRADIVSRELREGSSKT